MFYWLCTDSFHYSRDTIKARNPFTSSSYCCWFDQLQSCLAGFASLFWHRPRGRRGPAMYGQWNRRLCLGSSKTKVSFLGKSWTWQDYYENRLSYNQQSKGLSIERLVKLYVEKLIPLIMWPQILILWCQKWYQWASSQVSSCQVM